MRIFMPDKYKRMCTKLAKELKVDPQKIISLVDRAWRNGVEVGSQEFAGEPTLIFDDYVWSEEG